MSLPLGWRVIFFFAMEAELEQEGIVCCCFNVLGCGQNWIKHLKCLWRNDPTNWYKQNSSLTRTMAPLTLQNVLLRNTHLFHTFMIAINRFSLTHLIIWHLLVFTDSFSVLAFRVLGLYSSSLLLYSQRFDQYIFCILLGFNVKLRSQHRTLNCTFI